MFKRCSTSESPSLIPAEVWPPNWFTRTSPVAWKTHSLKAGHWPNVKSFLLIKHGCCHFVLRLARPSRPRARPGGFWERARCFRSYWPIVSPRSSQSEVSGNRSIEHCNWDSIGWVRSWVKEEWAPFTKRPTSSWRDRLRSNS